MNGTIDPVENERRMTKIETILDDVVENHLPHIDKKINWVIGILVSFMISIILLLIKLMT